MMQFLGYGFPVFLLIILPHQMICILVPINKKTRLNISNERVKRQHDITFSDWLEMLDPGSDASDADVAETTTVNNGVDLPLVRMTHDSTHCHNGGTGILGAFCVCPDNYAGQYCEKLIKESCDIMRSDTQEYIYIDCSVCRCADGYLECTPQWTPGCEEKERERQRKLDERNKQTRLYPQLTLITIATVMAILLNAQRPHTLDLVFR